MSSPSAVSFAEQVLVWFDEHGRHDLPWQVTDDPYAVWVSEIMLQQTQVKTVLAYYDRFMRRFPTVQTLAAAAWDDVAPYWAGLGYYARARNLHKAAQQVAEQGFPTERDGWMALSGIGRSTAGALLSLGQRGYGVIMDGNVKRVLTRYDAIEADSTRTATMHQLWQRAHELTPSKRTPDYNQAMMDLGATLCTAKNPLCMYCPLKETCKAHALGEPTRFPVKPKKQANPTYQWIMPVLTHGGRWLWQQRPARGVWGGLWCMPLVTEPEWVQLSQRFPELSGSVLSSTLTHGFSHQTWELKGYTLELDSAQADTLQTYFGGVWLSPRDASGKGIPSAMQRLLHELALAGLG